MISYSVFISKEQMNLWFVGIGMKVACECIEINRSRFSGLDKVGQ